MYVKVGLCVSAERFLMLNGLNLSRVPNYSSWSVFLHLVNKRIIRGVVSLQR